MKKLFTSLVLLLSIALSAVFLVGCTQGDYNYEVPKVLVVGYDYKFPPMGFVDKDTGDHIGFDLDLARAVGVHMGVDIKLESIKWAAKEDLLKNGTVDLIWNGYTMSDERLKQVDYSVPYMRNAQIAVVKAEATFQTLADLTGKRLYMQNGSTAVESYESYDFLKNNPTDKLDENETCFEKLRTDVEGAMITDKILAEFMMNKPENKGKFRIISEELQPEKYAIGIRRQDVGLRIALNDALIEMSNNGTLQEIAAKWNLQDALLI